MERALSLSLLVTCVRFISTTSCPGTNIIGYLSGSNILQFRDCTMVKGSLVINGTSLIGDSAAPGVPPVQVEQLSLLSSITEISGYLHIHDLNNSNITNLRFLKNLQVINGSDTIDYNGRGRSYALVIVKNHYLTTLGLSSLQWIANSGAIIADNAQLCLVDTLLTGNDFLVPCHLWRTTITADCSSYNCHAQCTARGCWGTLADECVECRNYDYLGTCLQSCDRSLSYANTTTKQCIPLAPPTTIVTTLHATISTSSQPHTHHTSTIQTDSTSPTFQSTHEPKTGNPLTTEARDATNKQLSWPVVAAPMIVTTVFIAFFATLLCCCYRVKTSGKKSLTSPAVKLDIENDNSVAHSKAKITLHELNSRHRQCNSIRDSNTTPLIIDNTSIHYYKNKTGSGGFSSKLLSKISPLRDETSSQEHSQRSSPYSLDTPPSFYKVSQNPVRSMHGGVYSTRTPPSYPHRLSYPTSTPHTHLTGTRHSHRGSLGSYHSGRSWRSVSMLSASSFVSNNSRTESHMTSSDNSLAE